MELKDIKNAELKNWLQHWIDLCTPDKVVFFDGSEWMYNEIANLTLGSDYIYCFGPGSGNNQHPANPKGATGWVLATAAFFICALITYKKVTKQIQRTQDSRTFNFVNKRQG